MQNSHIPLFFWSSVWAMCILRMELRCSEEYLLRQGIYKLAFLFSLRLYSLGVINLIGCEIQHNIYLHWHSWSHRKIKYILFLKGTVTHIRCSVFQSKISICHSHVYAPLAAHHLNYPFIDCVLQVKCVALLGVKVH